MSLSIDWTCAALGAVAGYYAKTKVEDTKVAAKQAISETASAAAIAAAQAINGQPSGQGQTGKAGH